MDPRYPNSPAPQQNPYSFINNTPLQPKKPLGPTTTKGRIIVVAVLAVVLIIAATIISNILGSAGKDQALRYVEIAKSQTEIVRISTLAEEKSKTLDGRSLAATTRLSFTSSQKDMNALLAKKGVSQKALSKELSASKNTKSDELLSEAEKNNRYDETYTEILQKEIENYKTLIKSASGGANPSELQTLEAAYNSASLIFKAE